MLETRVYVLLLCFNCQLFFNLFRFVDDRGFPENITRLQAWLWENANNEVYLMRRCCMNCFSFLSSYDDSSQIREKFDINRIFTNMNARIEHNLNTRNLVESLKILTSSFDVLRWLLSQKYLDTSELVECFNNNSKKPDKGKSNLKKRKLVEDTAESGNSFSKLDVNLEAFTLSNAWNLIGISNNCDSIDANLENKEMDETQSLVLELIRMLLMFLSTCLRQSPNCYDGNQHLYDILEQLKVIGPELNSVLLIMILEHSYPGYLSYVKVNGQQIPNDNLISINISLEVRKELGYDRFFAVLKEFVADTANMSMKETTIGGFLPLLLDSFQYLLKFVVMPTLASYVNVNMMPIEEVQVSVNGTITNLEQLFELCQIVTNNSDNVALIQKLLDVLADCICNIFDSRAGK